MKEILLMPNEIDDELVFDHLSVPFFAKIFNFLQNFYSLKFQKKKKKKKPTYKKQKESNLVWRRMGLKRKLVELTIFNLEEGKYISTVKKKSYTKLYGLLPPFHSILVK